MTNIIILITGILIALNVQAQLKLNPRVDLEYFQEDSLIHYLKVKVRKNIEKRFEPMEAVEVKFYLERESESIQLGSIVTNANGEGKLNLPESFSALLMELKEYQFTASVPAAPETEEASEVITIIPGRMKIRTDDADGKLIKILVQSRTAQGWTPVEGAEVKVFIKRTFGQLQVGEDVYASDENGQIELLFEGEIPGDSDGNIILGCVVEDNNELGNLSALTKVKWGVPLIEDDRFNKRTLWATRDKTPFWLLIFPNLIIAGVWGVIVYLFFQIFKMKRGVR